jgi:hypothetical protein
MFLVKFFIYETSGAVWSTAAIFEIVFTSVIPNLFALKKIATS